MKSLFAALLALPLSLSAQAPGTPTPTPPAPAPAPQPTVAQAPTPVVTQAITPAANLLIDGVPPIPAAVATEAQRYTEARGVATAAWHPQRRELLITTRFGNTTQLHLVRMPGGDRTQLTFFDEPVNAGMFDPTGKYVLFARDAGGSEFTQLYRLDLADSKVTLLTDGRSRNAGVKWSASGGRIAYTSTRRNGTDRDVYVMNPLDPATDRMVLQVSGAGWSISGWTPDGTRLLLVEYVSDTRSQLWLVEVATGQRALITPPGSDSVSYTAAQVAPDGRGVYVTTDRTSEFRQLFYFDLNARAFTPLTTDIPWNIDRFHMSPDGKRIAFEANEAGTSRVYLLETATRSYRPVAGLPSGVVGTMMWHPNSRELALTVSSAQSPSDAYSVDAESGQVTRWTESELGGLVGAELAEPTLLRWKSFDGLDISALYHRPPARFTGRRPVIINIRDEGQSRPAFLGRANYFVNELGIAIISPNVRGSTGYGKTFIKLDNGARRDDAVRDIGSLLDWIARQPDLDPSKVMVAGGGGYMTVAVVTRYNDRIAGAMTLGVATEQPAALPADSATSALPAANAAAVTSLITLLQTARPVQPRGTTGDARDSLRAFLTTSPLSSLGRPAGTDSAAAAAAAAAANPAATAVTLAKPLFVVQGANDPRVPVSAADEMVLRIRRTGIPVWYLLGKDEGHNFRKKDNVDFQFYAAVLFVRQYLLGEHLN